MCIVGGFEMESFGEIQGSLMKPMVIMEFDWQGQHRVDSPPEPAALSWVVKHETMYRIGYFVSNQVRRDQSSTLLPPFTP